MLIDKNIKVLNKENEIILINMRNYAIVKVHKDIYDIIKNIDNLDEIDKIAEDYSILDKEFFVKLKTLFEEKSMFEFINDTTIKKINYIITNICNLKCTHCCFSAKHNSETSLMKIVAEMNIIKNIVKLKPKQIVITGGEPLVVDNINNILEYLKFNYIGIVVLATNAILVNEKNVDFLVEHVNHFEISIDGINEDQCSKIRGEGVFSKVINSIKLLKSKGANNIGLSMVMDVETRKYAKDFQQMCKELGVRPIIRGMNLVGRARENQLNSDDVNRFEQGGIGNIECCYNCPGGVSEISVNYKGEVFPCNLFSEDRFKICMIWDDNLRDYLKWDKSSAWFEKFSEYIPNYREECNDCEIKEFCWNCPALAKSYIENSGNYDLKESCAKKRKGIYEALWS